MGNFVMLMLLCSAVNSPPCFQITTPKKVFDDYYSCVSFGYSHSTKIIDIKFKKEEVNRLRLYTKFSCTKQKLPQKDIDA